MALPLRVKNALSLGYDLAAPIPSELPEGRAWVYIEPKMKSGESYRTVKANWTRIREVNRSYDDTIEFYTVRLIEVSFWDEADLQYDDWYDNVKERIIRDYRTELPDAEALEEWLLNSQTDLNLLGHPTSVGYRFYLWYQ